MLLGWLSWSNPVSLWWGFLVFVSVINISAWVYIRHELERRRLLTLRAFPGRLMIILCGVYVFVCAFRAILPRADVQRIVLFNTWLSSVLVGRSVATVAELCFAAQWAIALYYLSTLTGSPLSRKISYCILPLIIIAECSSWYAVITTNYLGNVIEESIWAITFFLIVLGLCLEWRKFRGIVQQVIGLVILGLFCYIAFECALDVPMYFDRWQAAIANGTPLLAFSTGLQDMRAHWTVTHAITQWEGEIVWMTLYFSVAVWMSLLLSCIALVQDTLPIYLRER